MSQSTALLPRILLCFASLMCLAPAKAIPQAEVVKKLDTILLLMAVDEKGQPQLSAITLEGKPITAYLGAMSIDAAQGITTGKTYSVAQKDAAKLRFAPVSLARFNLLLEPLLKARPDAVGVIAPDPAQISVAQKLLIAQKVPADQAKTIAELQPMVFCPDPGLLVSSNDGPSKGKTFIPCATEAGFVESIVQRGIKQSSQIANTRPKVIAIPFNAFIKFLRQEPDSKVGSYQVVPSGQMVELIQKISRQQASSPSQPMETAPSTKPNEPASPK